MTRLLIGREVATVDDIRALVKEGLADAAEELIPQGSLDVIDSLGEFMSGVQEQLQRIEDKLDELSERPDAE